MWTFWFLTYSAHHSYIGRVDYKICFIAWHIDSLPPDKFLKYHSLSRDIVGIFFSPLHPLPYTNRFQTFVSNLFNSLRYKLTRMAGIRRILDMYAKAITKKFGPHLWLPRYYCNSRRGVWCSILILTIWTQLAGFLSSCRCFGTTISWWAIWSGVVHGEWWTHAWQSKGSFSIPSW